MRVGVAVLVAAAVVAGCAPEEEELPSGRVSIALARGTGDDIDVVVHVEDESGEPLEGAPPALTVDGGSATALQDAGGGDYTATISPDALDTEVVISAETADATATKTALAFGLLASGLGQPEALDGYVNTAGWEDGANISSDGEWLIVSSYIPLDALSCALDGYAASSSACRTVLGPSDAPERPQMLGAERIDGDGFANVCPSFGITTENPDFAFIPIAAYGFRRQDDGSYREPFVIGYDADGCLGPYGMSFIGTPSGTSATAIFAHHDPLLGGNGTDSDLYWTPLTLGEPNILGTYSFNGSNAELTGDVTQRIEPILPVRQGNPTISGGRVWWDNEDLLDTDRDLMFADLTGTLPAVSAGSAMTVGMSMSGVEEIQPSLDGNDLYFMSAGRIGRTALTGSDPALAGSWGAREMLLGPTLGTQILAIGEPTIAHVPGGGTELYFVYIKRTATGFDGNVGRVSLP